MSLAEAALELESPPDPAYPTTTPPDSMYPCQTREPVGVPLDGVVVPAMWSRLARPMASALAELCDCAGLLHRGRTETPVALHYGRIALNAHLWERMRTRISEGEPDPALVGPPSRGVLRLVDVFEQLRVRLSARKLAERLEAAQRSGEAQLRSVAERHPSELETPELARGPLDERAWGDLLLPWLGLRLHGLATASPDALVRAGVALEERFAAELGRRLVVHKVLEDHAAVAYLTVHERLRAVHEPSPFWTKLVRERQERVESFVELDVPLRFWGRPRVEGPKTG